MASDAATAKAILAVATAPPQKSGATTAALWFFLAGFGGPWWYLGRPFSAIAAFVAYAICTALIFAGVGLVLLPLLWIIDALAVRSSYKKHNGDREKLLRAAVA
jgi:hypothetical protein